MDTNKTFTSTASAARDFFSLGETARQWMAQWKELTEQDKEEILQGLRQVGYKIEPKS